MPDEAVTRTVLDNGLVILTSKSGPVDLAAIDLQIKVGSSLEGEYLGSGISHFTEHMIFKGTMSRKSGEIERDIKALGGFLNASTSIDSTNLYVTVPSANAAKTLAILKDMLANASFDQQEFDREKDVILKEIKLYNDQPENRVSKNLYQAAFMTHPYRYPIIGFEERFRQLKRDDIVKHYNRMYVPNRMILCMVSGSGDALEAAKTEFAGFNKPTDYQTVAVDPEPPQVMKRSVGSEAEINLAYLAMGFHSTSIFDKDLFAMDVLAMVLGRGDNSRLVSSLVKQKRIAYSAAAWNYTPRDPGLFVITALFDRKNSGPVETHILEELKKVRDGDVKDGELATAKRMVLSDYIFSRQTIEEEARDLSSNELLTGSCDFSRRYVEGIQSVTSQDVRRVASLYLDAGNMTISRLMPKGSITAAEEGAGTSAAKDSIDKYTLPNGLRILLRENRKTPTVAITVALLGGTAVEEASLNGASNLVSRMLLKGTSTIKEDMIKGAFDSMGGNISPFSGMSSFGVSASLLKDDLDRGITILHSILTDSVFPAGELEKEKELILAAIKDEDDDIFQRGVNALRKDLYPDSPFGMRYLGSPETISAMTHDSLMAFYKRYCSADNMVISVSGDIDKASVLKKMTEMFKDMKKKGLSLPRLEVKPLNGIKTRAIAMDRDQSLLLAGFLACGIDNPDRYSIDVLCSILSGSSGRLFTELRDKLSLAYTLGCGPRFSLDTGYIVFYIATTKDRLGESRKALAREINMIRDADAGADELEHARRERITGYDIDMQTNNFVSSQSAMDELYGLGSDNVFKYKEAVMKITKEDIRAASRKYLNMEAYSEVEISPER